jgi:hypothetical protein
VPACHTHSVQAETPTKSEEYGFPGDIKCFKWTAIFSELSGYLPLVNYMVGLSESQSRYDGVYWKEGISCSLLKSLKLLIDDQKVKLLLLFT